MLSTWRHACCAAPTVPQPACSAAPLRCSESALQLCPRVLRLSVWHPMQAAKLAPKEEEIQRRWATATNVSLWACLHQRRHAAYHGAAVPSEHAGWLHSALHTVPLPGPRVMSPLELLEHHAGQLTQALDHSRCTARSSPHPGAGRRLPKRRWSRGSGSTQPRFPAKTTSARCAALGSGLLCYAPRCASCCARCCAPDR